MKKIGYILIILGGMIGLQGITMEISVFSSYSGTRVNNLGLMNDRISLLITGGFLLLSGVLMVGFASKREPKEESSIKASAMTALDRAAQVYEEQKRTSRPLTPKEAHSFWIWGVGCAIPAMLVMTGVLGISLIVATAVYGGGLFLLIHRRRQSSLPTAKADDASRLDPSL